MAAKHGYKISDVARMTGVSVRTLRYYDEIGLLTPAGRSSAGYRLYDDDDLLRMQQILIGRSLGLSLEEIGRGLDDPAFDMAESLQRQRRLLTYRLNETHKMIASIDAALEKISERTRKEMDMTTLFDGFDPASFDKEAKEKWGETAAYRESARRTKTYGEDQWRAIKAEGAQIWADAAAAMQAGEPHHSGAASEIVERHRSHICRWFYDLTPEAHGQLAALWRADPRFAETIEGYGAGLTEWLAKAVDATAARMRAVSSDE
ncbi:MAG: MerR family transcriptional regulator [Pseudomonadota bacterium]